MSLGLLVLNVAYAVYTASAAFKDILWLRLTLLVATVLFMVYGIIEPNWSVFFWNIPVALLHLWAIWQLLKSRRNINLDDEAKAIHTLIFPELNQASFNTLWTCGEIRIVRDRVLITKAEEVAELILILDGEVDVEVSAELTVRLSKYRLVGEMSSLSGATASATVRAQGRVRMRAWNKSDLDVCAAKNPEIKLALLKAMGQEVTRKLH